MSLQEAAKAEAQALADVAAVGGEASEREARDLAGVLAAATERQEAVCRSLLHELRFKKHAALEAGALPPCAGARTLTCGTDRPSVVCLTTARSSCIAVLVLCMVPMWLPGSTCTFHAAAMSCPSPSQSGASSASDRHQKWLTHSAWHAETTPKAHGRGCLPCAQRRHQRRPARGLRALPQQPASRWTWAAGAKPPCAMRQWRPRSCWLSRRRMQLRMAGWLRAVAKGLML